MTRRFLNQANVSSLQVVLALVASVLTTAGRALVRTRAIIIAVPVILSLLLVACGGSPPVVVSVSAPTESTWTNGTITFTATITGSTNTAVTWSIQEGEAGGTITAAGVYTAPS